MTDSYIKFEKTIDLCDGHDIASDDPISTIGEVTKYAIELLNETLAATQNPESDSYIDNCVKWPPETNLVYDELISDKYFCRNTSSLLDMLELFSEQLEQHEVKPNPLRNIVEYCITIITAEQYNALVNLRSNLLIHNQGEVSINYNHCYSNNNDNQIYVDCSRPLMRQIYSYLANGTRSDEGFTIDTVPINILGKIYLGAPPSTFGYEKQLPQYVVDLPAGLYVDLNKPIPHLTSGFTPSLYTDELLIRVLAAQPNISYTATGVLWNKRELAFNTYKDSLPSLDEHKGNGIMDVVTWTKFTSTLGIYDNILGVKYTDKERSEYVIINNPRCIHIYDKTVDWGMIGIKSDIVMNTLDDLKTFIENDIGIKILKVTENKGILSDDNVDAKVKIADSSLAIYLFQVTQKDIYERSKLYILGNGDMVKCYVDINTRITNIGVYLAATDTSYTFAVSLMY